MAAMWGLWHLPMFFVPQSLQAQDSVLRFGSAILAWSSLHALLQLDQLSVATAMVYHAATNLSLQVLDVDLGAFFPCTHGHLRSRGCYSRREYGDASPASLVMKPHASRRLIRR
jgi:hypothetical protein